MRRSTAICACAVAATVLAAQTVASTARTKTGSRYSGGTVIASLRNDTLALHSSPTSPKVIARVGRKTVFGSTPQLAVVGEENGWVEVVSELLENGTYGFARRSNVSLTRRAFVLEADLSRFELSVWRWGDRERRFRIAIGAPATPTPTGRFSVTDRLHIFPEIYGCCILALSGRQPQPLAGWLGGDRLAIHEGRGLGSAITGGCLRAAGSDMRYLMRTIPLGTQIVIHR